MDRPPWDDRYEQAPAPLVEVGLPDAEAAVPFLLERLTAARNWEALDAAEALLGLALGGDRWSAKAPKQADPLTDLQRDVLRRLVANDGAWERESELHSLLRDHRLSQRRDDLRAWLGEG